MTEVKAKTEMCAISVIAQKYALALNDCNVKFCRINHFGYITNLQNEPAPKGADFDPESIEVLKDGLREETLTLTSKGVPWNVWITFQMTISVNQISVAFIENL